MTVTITSITFVRYKQLKGGKLIARSIRTITDGIKTTSTGEGSERFLIVDINSKFASGSMMGNFNVAAGRLTMNADKVMPEGYLKRKQFKPVGYTPMARITNINKRKKPLEIKTERSKSVQQGPVKKGRGF